MSHGMDERLQRLLGGGHLAALRRRLRRHYERLPPDDDRAAFRVTGLTPEEHAALASLVGRHPRFTGSLLVDERAVDQALRDAGIAASLREALEALDGPIVNGAAARAERERLWSGVIEGCLHAGLARYLASPAAGGLLKRLSGNDPTTAAGLCSSVQTVLHRLPAQGLTRAQLAAETLGDPHALDNGQAAATLVLAVWRHAAVPADAATDAVPADAAPDAMPADADDAAGAPDDLRAEKSRDTWARAGVLVNELARPALVLNLPVGDGTNTSHPPGEPGYLSLRLLVRAPPLWGVAHRTVYVCENPNLLAIAADRLGARCRPLVCTDGMPAAAQARLLSQLSLAGASLHYHGDFDWAGLHIGNHVTRAWGARPWRFAAADYLAAVGKLPRPGRPLEGAPAVASWDDRLACAMQSHDVAVSEESVAETLLRDLDSSAVTPDDSGL
ncbi:MAG TPA: TIGR02679 family protein [Acetobacteraceae bacterium]|jgi:uncharacterized protein (TIGR02679 family)